MYAEVRGSVRRCSVCAASESPGRPHRVCVVVQCWAL